MWSIVYDYAVFERSSARKENYPRSCNAFNSTYGEEANTANRDKDPMFDYATLNDIRTFMHPLYSPVPSFPITTSTVTANSRTELESMVKVKPFLEHRAADWSDEPWTTLKIPCPEISYAHANGCIYSDLPDVVLKSSKAVQTTDRLEEGGPADINALVEVRDDHELSSVFDKELVLKVVREDCIKGSESGSEKDASSTSDSECSSRLSDTTTNTEEHAPSTMERVFSEAAESEARIHLRAEKVRLEESLATSRLAKGMYFKRCNGDWVSGVGDILRHGKSQNIAGNGVEDRTCAAEQEAGEKDAASGLVDNGDGRWDGRRDGRRLSLKDDKSTTSTATASSTSTRLGGPNFRMSSSSSTNSPFSMQNAGISIRAQNTTITAPKTCPEPHFTSLHRPRIPTSGALGCAVQNYKPSNPSALWNYAAENHASNAAELQSKAEVKAEKKAKTKLVLKTEVFAEAKSSANARFGPGILSVVSTTDRATAPPFRFSTDMLMNREELVRGGQVGEEDLILTCWAFNRLVRAQDNEIWSEEEEGNEDDGALRTG